jgi:hypothetical protein
LSSEAVLPELPAPPEILDPLLETWEAGKPMLRCHNVRFGATEFNPGLGSGRFHPFKDRSGYTVPVLYAADTFDGVLSETVFHGVAIGGRSRFVLHSSLRPLVVSALRSRRDLVLVQLHGHGLRRLGLDRSVLIDSEADTYESTARWARALHRVNRRLHGLTWVSRQHDTSRALVLFGDRVDRRDLEVAEAPLPLFVGVGLERAQAAAEAAGVTIVE